MRLSRALVLIYCAGFLRSLGVGLLGVILAVYLSRAGVSTTSIGVVIGVGLLGACAATAWVTWAGVRLGCRTALWSHCLCSRLQAASHSPILPSYPILLVLVFVGMVNGMGTDRSAAFALEQAIIPGLIPDRNRTWGLSWYNVLLDGGGAIGALAAVLPLAVSSWAHIDLLGAYRYVFLGYASVHAVTALLYFTASRRQPVAQLDGAHHAGTCPFVADPARPFMGSQNCLQLTPLGGAFYPTLSCPIGSFIASAWQSSRLGYCSSQFTS